MACSGLSPTSVQTSPAVEGAENWVEGEGFAIRASSRKDEAHKGAQMDWG